MKQKKQLLKANEVISMSESTKEKILNIAEDLRGKELFSNKIELAKKTLDKLKSLPI